MEIVIFVMTFIESFQFALQSLMRFLLIADSMAANIDLPSTDVRVFNSGRTEDYGIRKLLRSLRNAQYDHIIFLFGGNDFKAWGEQPPRTGHQVYQQLQGLADLVRHKVKLVHIVGLIRPSEDSCFVELQKTNDLLLQNSTSGSYIYCEVPSLFYGADNFYDNGQYFNSLMSYNLKLLLVECVINKFGLD